MAIDDSPSQPLLSVVTAVLNAPERLLVTRACIENACAMGAGCEIEHIIVDGASGAPTQRVLAGMRASGAVVISEPDTGIYQAVNKGIRRARGQHIWVLHAGDSRVYRLRDATLQRLTTDHAHDHPDLRHVLYRAVALACLPVFISGREIARWEGAVFVGYYVAYVAYLILAAQQHAALEGFSMVMMGFVVPLTIVTLVVVLLRHKAPAKAD